MISSRKFLMLLAPVFLASLPSAAMAQTQDYPSKPVRFVVGFAPGGSSDIAARIIGQWLTDRLGKQFVIENRAGAASGIAADTVARAAPDGHTLLLVSSADAINATLHPRAGFSFLRDIAPVASLTVQPQVLIANPALAVSNFTQLLAHAKAEPGKLSIASAGNGSISHLAGELLKIRTGIEMVHLPYRGAGPALTDLLAGHVQLSFAGMAGAIQHLKSGRLRALAVTTQNRSEALPDVTTIGEHIAGYTAVSFFGIGAPKATPQPIVDLVSKEVNAGLADAKVAARFVELGGSVQIGTPASFGKLVADETEKWAQVIKAAGIKAEK